MRLTGRLVTAIRVSAPVVIGSSASMEIHDDTESAGPTASFAPPDEDTPSSSTGACRFTRRRAGTAR
jgi:hypothetical protein